ncbi:MAG: aminotransferase class III-fold pyridoxal phosphate-dependent enzyme [Candidatus Magasanikbacteria bacterium]|nr:aminotransferase class III-fold pyridoxal phosphate-dependent enzyme [Candidatus Magasanikbacteria bacterium]
MGKSQKLWLEAKKVIPGGTQLLSKRAEMFLPDNWPAYYQKAKGIEVVDLDGKKYLDMSIMGVGSCILGYADKDVNSAVKKVIDNGSMCTLNSPEEVELAKLLLSIHPWAGMVRYARTGGEAVAVAVRIARASAGKQKVAFCGYHGWHDWYLSGNLASDKNLNGHLLPGLEPRGVPNELFNSAIPFQFNQIDQLRKIVKENSIGVIIMEVFRHQEPKNNFLQDVRKIADEIGAVLIFDEVSSGFRMCLGGVHSKYQVNPDITVFGKAMSNGFPMAAIIGKKKIMDSAQLTFISSTYWTERIGPTAALATIKKLRKKKVFTHLDKIGALVGKGWDKLAKKHGLDIKVIGPMAIITIEFNYRNSQAIKTLFIQEMLRRGFLASLSVYLSFAHKEHHIKKYLKSVDEVFGIIKEAIDNKNVEKLLEGPVAHSGFARLT